MASTDKSSKPDPKPEAVKQLAKAIAGPSSVMDLLPGLQWKNLGVFVAIDVLLWITAFASGSKALVVLVALVTLLFLGAMAYVYNWAKKQFDLLQMMKKAQESPEGRAEALAFLNASDDKDSDPTKAIARANLLAQEDPEAAIAILEKVKLETVPIEMANEVRGARAQMYLANGRIDEARSMADGIDVAKSQAGVSRALLIATVSEAWARSGKIKEAVNLLSTIKFEDKEYEPARVPMRYARIYSSFADGRKDHARKDMAQLVKADINYLGRFLNPAAHAPLELQKMAKDVIMADPEARKMVQKEQSRAMRRQR